VSNYPTDEMVSAALQGLSLLRAVSASDCGSSRHGFHVSRTESDALTGNED
jgi:hypothetical protein